MGIMLNRSSLKPIHELKRTIGGKQEDLDEDKEDTPASDTTEAPADDAPDTEADDTAGDSEDYTIPDDEEDTGDTEESEDDGEDSADYTADDAGDSEDDATDYTEDDSGEEDDEEDAADYTADDTTGEDTGEADDTADPPEGGDEDAVDYTDNGSEEGEDKGDAAPADDATGEDASPNKDELKELESSLFSGLSPEQIEIKHYELKKQFIELYNVVCGIIEKINNIVKTKDNTPVISFSNTKLIELKELIHFYLTKTYSTKTYTESSIMYQRYLATIEVIRRLLAEIKVENDQMSG